MSKILGMHVRLDAKRYRVGFAMLDGTEQIAFSYSLHAPSEDEPRQLAELRRTTLEVLRAQAPDHVVLANNESQSAAFLRSCAHAEGVLLAVCGEKGLEVGILSGVALKKPAGLSGAAKVAQAITALCADVGFSSKDADIEHAAAAALAFRRRKP